MPSSLVTGGAGFIGSHVAEELVGMGHRVVVLDDLSGGFKENVPAGARLVRGSVVDKEIIDKLFASERFDYVFHLAAYAAEGLSHFIKRFNYTNNLIGSVNLTNAAVNAGTVKCFVFTSSIAVYGRNQVPMTEDMAPAPEDPYGIAKYAVEMDLAETREMFGLPYVVFRPHNVYGERQNLGDRYRNVIGIFMNQAMRGEPFTVFGDGRQTRAFSHVSEVAPVIARVCERPDAWGQVFNIGADKPCAVADMAKVVAEAMGVELKLKHLPPRNETVHAYSSHEKILRCFGDVIKPVALEDGIRRMAAWAKTAGPRKPSEFGAIEVAKNLPPGWRL
ncbi:MAG TPA: NAD-dependent epimerase/dehydratase family protein [Elusimicrobiota bacterium]|nr:NAD-dependent epimerase/dehydratase family protein [Elusimicrobiota bacterium]